MHTYVRAHPQLFRLSPSVTGNLPFSERITHGFGVARKKMERHPRARASIKGGEKNIWEAYGEQHPLPQGFNLLPNYCRKNQVVPLHLYPSLNFLHRINLRAERSSDRCVAHIFSQVKARGYMGYDVRSSPFFLIYASLFVNWKGTNFHQRNIFSALSSITINELNSFPRFNVFRVRVFLVN